MYTRSVQIANLINFLTYPEFREALAKAATLSTPVEYYIHEENAKFFCLFMDVKVDVWGSNQGTVDDLCNKFLGKVAKQPTSIGISLALIDYQASIDLWVQCERRSLGLYPFRK